MEGRKRREGGRREDVAKFGYGCGGKEVHH